VCMRFDIKIIKCTSQMFICTVICKGILMSRKLTNSNLMNEGLVIRCLHSFG